MRTVSKIFLMLAASIFIFACAKDLITGKKVLNYYNIENEPKLGAEVLEAQIKALKKKKKEVDSKKNKDELERLKKIVARIAAVSHHPNFPYEVHLADIDVVNAWCAPGGKMMVFEGLWDSKEGLVEKGNENELAAVLSHEISHATARHVTEAISRNMTIVLIGTAVSSALSAGGYEEGSNLFGRIFSQGLDVFVPAYSRKNELEADSVGLMYMAKAGFDPSAAIELWKKAAKKKKDFTSLYASHPSSGVRAKELEKLLPKAMELYEAAKASGK